MPGYLPTSRPGHVNVGSSGRLDRGSFAKALQRVFASLQPVVPQPDATWSLDDDWPHKNVEMGQKLLISTDNN